LTFNLIKNFGAALGKNYAKLQVATLVRRYIMRPGLHAGQLIVQLDPFRGDAALRPFIQQLNERQLPIPWLAGLILQVEIAAKPQGLAAVPSPGAENTCQLWPPWALVGKSVCHFWSGR